MADCCGSDVVDGSRKPNVFKNFCELSEVALMINMSLLNFTCLLLLAIVTI